MNEINAYIIMYREFVEKNMLLPIGAARIERFLSTYSLSSGSVYDFFMGFAEKYNN